MKKTWLDTNGKIIIEDMLGNASILRAVTASLRVSPNGSGIDGLSWQKAYTTIQDALDAASTDPDDCTLILISPHTTYYDIDRTGDPTWEANLILVGTHRNWAKIKNDHPTATSIMKLTGKASVIDLNFNLGTGGNGLIMTHGGCRGYHIQFVGEDLTEAGIALWLDGSPSNHGKFIDLHFLGHTTHMTALKVDQFAHSYFELLRIHECASGIQVVGADADSNHFNDIDIGGCGIGFDLDEGNGQHLDDVLLHDNVVNIDDEVGDHHYSNIRGDFNIKIEPDNLVGVQVDCGGAGVYGGDTEIRAAVSSTKPFRIVGVHVEPSANEWYTVRFSADSGVTFYDKLLFDGTKREGMAAPSGTEYILNKGTRISASARSETGGNNVKVWIEVQEI
ncbi:hypothetical protein ES703_67432 [subsurface metagenome]